jgi:hypothetical protein
MSMKGKKIHVFEFSCQAPLRFYERCSKCVRFDDVCPDLQLGIELLRRKKTINYGTEQKEDSIHANEFNCSTPLKYFEKTRTKCAHKGKCRDEGLLTALLNGKRRLEYAQMEAIPLPKPKKRRNNMKVQNDASQQAIG